MGYKYPQGRKKLHSKTGTLKTGADPLVNDMRSERNAQIAGEAWAKESREPAKDDYQRKQRLNAGRRAARNLLSAARARGRLMRGTSGMKK